MPRLSSENADSIAFVGMMPFTEWPLIGYRALLHGFTDAMIEVPRRLVAADPEIPLQLLCADSLFCVQQERDGLEPHYEGNIRIGKQGAGSWREL